MRFKELRYVHRGLIRGLINRLLQQSNREERSTWMIIPYSFVETMDRSLEILHSSCQLYNDGFTAHKVADLPLPSLRPHGCIMEAK